AGIGERASAALDDGRVVVTPAPGTGTSHVSVLTREDEPASRPAPAGEPVVRVRGLAKRYGETRVLDGLDAEFSGGRLYAVTGPSGSGKTTFLHLLAGLDLPDAGTVEVDGVELTSLDRAGRAAHRRRTIAYVGQQVGLVPHLSAVENVELALSLRGMAKSRAEALHALEAVGLAERATQRVARLSQGERT